MKKGAAILTLIVTVALSMAAVTAFRRDHGSAPLPTALVAKTTFVDFLQLRGEIRPVRSVVLTAPSTGTDLQIVELATNGAKVAAGDVVVIFDPTVQQRTLETKQSELKQARDLSSKKPTVAGLSNSGGRNACRVRSPTSSC